MAIVRRGDGYGVRVWRDGRHYWLGTYAKLTDAKRAEAEARIRPAISGTMTVGAWAALWQQEYARPAAATRSTYGYACQQIVRDLGAHTLESVDRPTAKAMANRWPRNTSRVARTMWADALRDGIVQANPFTSLRLETPKGRRDITALTEPEIDRLSQLARDAHGDYGDEAAAIVLFAAYTGLRPGELAALRWDDLRPAEREATISRALDGSGGEKPPKNGLARVIILPPRALEALSLVARRTDSPYVFHSPRGRRLSKGTLTYLWRPVAVAWAAKGGRDIDLYELRHACATLLLERGLTPADVAVQLGHTDGGRLVQTLYGHPDEARARDRLRMAFAGDGRKDPVAEPIVGRISDASR
jgi:integrase